MRPAPGETETGWARGVPRDEAILTAINAGDAERADALARGHCEAAGSSLAVQVRSHFEEASA